MRPKYIGGLLLALLAAAAFAWLGQWQLDRALTKDQTIEEIQKTVMIPLGLDIRNVFIIDGRKQNGHDVYWLIANSTEASGKSVTLALGQTDSLLKAESIRFDIKNSAVFAAFLPVEGSWLPSEAPQKIDAEKPYLLHSVSIAQLLNLYSPDKALESYPEFLVTTQFAKGYGLGEIHAVLHPAPAINWLSAFYAFEWVLFSGFAVFLWGRTVKDAVDAERLN
ncbi:MAG: hypothetical protein RLZZ164_892 [Actinomycetota bacterium]